MAQVNTATMTKLHLAIIVEHNDDGSHREFLWYGGTPGNLGLMIIDVMKDWYEPNKKKLDKSIINYHKMLENADALTFKKLEGEGFHAGGRKLFVQISNDINVMFTFIIDEICSIFAQNGETAADFKSLGEFKQHFTTTYNLDEGLTQVLNGVNEATISRALLTIDMKYDFTGRHSINKLN